MAPPLESCGVVCCSPSAARSVHIASPFVALVPAFNREGRSQIEALAGALIDQGCVEFCCVGPEAEQLHDALDWIIEDKATLDVVTTWFEDEAEACEFFLLTTLVRQLGLLAVVSEHPALEACLQRLAGSGTGVDR
jgi:hypothetical protein